MPPSLFKRIISFQEIIFDINFDKQITGGYERSDVSDELSAACDERSAFGYERAAPHYERLLP